MTPTTQPTFQNATFIYDGDGKRVKSVINSAIITYFVGAHYEVSGATVTKYYYAGAQRIAMRSNGTLSYLLGDHLGSTSLTTDAAGNKVSEIRYKAWGEVRYATQGVPTRYQYTGQYSYEPEFGLYFYNARWYDSSLGRFAQADTIIPEQTQGVQAWDRYAYTNNNPLRYTDPAGHMMTEGCGDDGKGACVETDPKKIADNARILKRLEREAHDRKCAAGNDAYCVTALEHPVETTLFVGGGLLLAGGGMAAVGTTAVTAETVTITTTTVEGANIACGNDMCASETEQIVTVIGRYDANKQLADSIGANWLNIQDDVWNAMSMAERWARNKQWLQEAVIRGDVFRLASPISEAAPGSWYAKELNYLFSLGYTVTANQQYLIPPVFLP